ncbi:MAG: DUF4350 domain-containing protein, partial [Frankiaceae bacterium]|nr:DUF4350 domain-containing protein [Frankiaceae bacterium]
MTAVTVEQPLDLTGIARRLRFPAAIAVLGIALISVFAALGKESNTGLLDPRNANPNGGRALATLVAERGVAVSTVSAIADLRDSPATTVLIAQPSAVSAAALLAVAASTSTVVLVDPDQTALGIFRVPATPDAITDKTTVSPGCSLAAATTAGDIEVSGDLYRTRGPATGCYQIQGDAAVVSAPRGTATTVVLGAAGALTNEQLADEGDAALGLGLLDNDQVDWVPGSLDAGPATGHHRGLLHLLPSRMLWAVLQLVIVVVLLAFWRARRLGAPVVEPLPVIVRASETVEGQAQLLHAAKARGAAAQALRAATIRRLSGSLRLG